MLGKISGGGLGVLLGALFGDLGLGLALGLIGALLGHLLIDRDSIPLPRALMPPSTQQLLNRPDQALARALCPIFIEVARADGEVNQDEIRVVKDFFEAELHFEGNSLEAVRVALKEAIAAPTGDLEALVKSVRAQVKPPDRLRVVSALYALALIDGDLSRSESDALKRVVTSFNLSEEQLREITAQQLGDGRRHYAVLGVAPEASDDEIKAAFRRLAAEHHPDHAASAGPQASEGAAEKFTKIKDAYDDLKKLRGL